MGLVAPTIASRGNHHPVSEYLLPDGSESRAGTTGIYANPGGPLQTGASNLGNVTGFEFFAVPGTNIEFDVFPDAFAAADFATIVTKGNYTDASGFSRTGVYDRDLVRPEVVPTSMVPIADSQSTLIPGTSVVFGATAPPSAVGRLAVFAGLESKKPPRKSVFTWLK